MNASPIRLTADQRRQYLQIFLGKGKEAADEWLEQNRPLVVVNGGTMSAERAAMLKQFFESLPPKSERDYLTTEESKRLKEIFDYETLAPFGGKLIVTIPASTLK